MNAKKLCALPTMHKAQLTHHEVKKSKAKSSKTCQLRCKEILHSQDVMTRIRDISLAIYRCSPDDLSRMKNTTCPTKLNIQMKLKKCQARSDGLLYSFLIVCWACIVLKITNHASPYLYIGSVFCSFL